MWECTHPSATARCGWHGTFSRNASGVRAINGLLTFAPTPQALGLNVGLSLYFAARTKYPRKN
jgi:hypothetical protein